MWIWRMFCFFAMKLNFYNIVLQHKEDGHYFALKLFLQSVVTMQMFFRIRYKILFRSLECFNVFF